MNVKKLEVDRVQAQALYRAYRAHRGSHTKEDAEIERIYYQISRGRKIIDAFESIRAAGVDAVGRPKLAMIRADIARCRFTTSGTGVTFCDESDRWRRSRQVEVLWPEFSVSTRDAVAMVPMIPVYLRPQAAGLAKYHILWEADWEKVPVDPMLLRRITRNAWLVVAAWDLTAVEQAVLAGRL